MTGADIRTKATGRGGEGEGEQTDLFGARAEKKRLTGDFDMKNREKTLKCGKGKKNGAVSLKEYRAPRSYTTQGEKPEQVAGEAEENHLSHAQKESATEKYGSITLTGRRHG